MAFKEHSALDADFCGPPGYRTSEEFWSPRKARNRPLREVALTVYFSIALLLLAMPQSVSERLTDFPPSALTDGASRILAVVSDVADLTGLPQLYEATRREFLKSLRRNSRHRSRS
jgi:hypothetical protein